MDRHNPASIITLIFILATIDQYLVDQIKAILPAKFQALLNPKNKNSWISSGFVAFAFGILLSFLSQADILEAVGVKSINPLVDYVLTGLLISGGSGLLHDLFKAISNISHQAQKMENDLVKDVADLTTKLSDISTTIEEFGKTADGTINQASKTLQDLSQPVSGILNETKTLTNAVSSVKEANVIDRDNKTTYKKESKSSLFD